MNQLITREKVEDILNYITPIGDNGERLKINRLEPYQKAFVHKSYLLSPDPRLPYNAKTSNERSEFLGDKFLGAVVSFYLIQRYPDDVYPNVQEGFLTKVQSRIVRSNMLCKLARFLGLSDYLLLSPEVDKQTLLYPNKGRNSPRVHEDVFESLVGAIIEDFGDEQGYRFVKRFVLAFIEHPQKAQIDLADLIRENENHKDTLQRYFQRQRQRDPRDPEREQPWPNPVYEELYRVGPVTVRMYTQGVFITSNQLSVLDPKVHDVVKKFHTSTVRNVNSETRFAIERRCRDNKAWIIGIGTSLRKQEAEQTAARQALANLGIDINWEL